MRSFARINAFTGALLSITGALLAITLIATALLLLKVGADTVYRSVVAPPLQHTDIEGPGIFKISYEGAQPRRVWQEVSDVRVAPEGCYYFYTDMNGRRTRIQCPIAETVVEKIIVDKK